MRDSFGFADIFESRAIPAHMSYFCFLSVYRYVKDVIDCRTITFKIFTSNSSVLVHATSYTH